MRPQRPIPLPAVGSTPTFEEQEADPKAIWNSVAGGRYQVSPFEDESVKRMLGEHYDERTRRERGAQQESNPLDYAAGQFVRMQTDAASGPNGYARQWVPFFESLRGSHVKMGGEGGLITGLSHADGSTPPTEVSHHTKPHLAGLQGALGSSSGDVSIPPVAMPTVVQPEVEMPEVDMPGVTMPKVNMPALQRGRTSTPPLTGLNAAKPTLPRTF